MKGRIDNYIHRYMAIIATLDNQGCVPGSLFYTCDPDNLAVFKSITSTLSEMYHEEKEYNPDLKLIDFLSDLEEYRHSKDLTSAQEEYNDDGVLMLISTACSVGYFNDDMEVEFCDTDKVTIGDVTKFADMQLYNSPKGIILSDGRFFPARNYHEGLIPLMLAHGLDLRGAIRVTFSDMGDKKYFYFTSFYDFDSQYTFFNDDYVLDITSEQAQTMYESFVAFKQKYGMTDNIVDVLELSADFGWEMKFVIHNKMFLNDTIASDNINKIMTEVFKKHPVSDVHADQAIVSFESTALESNRITRAKINCNCSDTPCNRK